MRQFSFVVLVVLSACASAPGDNDVSKRKASWQGAPVDELVAVLGQPGEISDKGTWYWQFWASPEKRDSYVGESESLSLSDPPGCRNCAPSSLTGSPAPRPAYSFLSGGGPSPKSESRPPPVCTYLVQVENGTIVKLSTLSARGAYCQFEELPMRPNMPERGDYLQHT